MNLRIQYSVAAIIAIAIVCIEHDRGKDLVGFVVYRKVVNDE